MSISDREALPVGWTAARLPDLISQHGVLTDGDWVETEDQDPNGDVRLTQLADVGDGVFRDRSNRFMTSAKAAELQCTYLQPGDVLIARMPDPLGRACSFPGDPRPSVSVVDVCIVRPATEPLSNRWLMNFINAPDFRASVAQLQSGSTRKRISKANLCTIQLPVPPAPEQHRIVEAIESYFTRLDDAVATLERVQRNLKRYRTSVLKAAVEGRLVSTEAELARAEGRDYEPASLLLERILAERRRRWQENGSRGKYHEHGAPEMSSLTKLPEGWRWVRLDGVCDVQLGQQRAPVHTAAEIQHPYVRAANITWSGLDLSDVKFMGFPDRERYRLKYGDVLLSEASGSPMEAGKPAVWKEQIAGACYQKTLLRVRALNPDRLLPEYLRLVFLRDCLTGKFARLAPGVGIVHITAERLVAWTVPLPPTEEQRRIVAETERVESILSRLSSSATEQIAGLARLRQSILKWAFEGKLADQDPNDEPATALLERIRLQTLASRLSAGDTGDRRRRRSGTRRSVRAENKP